MSKTIGELVIEKTSARMENSPLLKKVKMVRINVYSPANEEVTFDISVPEKKLDEIRQTVSIADGLSRWKTCLQILEFRLSSTTTWTKMLKFTFHSCELQCF